MPAQRGKIQEWIINHQHKLVVERYVDLEEGKELIDFFAQYLYPPYADRRAYEERNAFISKMVGIYRRGKLKQKLGPAVVIYAPMIWLADRMKDLPEYLQRMVALYDQANELDGRIIDHIAGEIDSETQMSEEIYNEAFRATSTLEERRAQVNEIVDVGGFAVTVVNRGGIATFILRYVPRVPIFANNPTVRGLNESIKMVQTGFRAFKNRGDSIYELKEFCRKHELEYVDEVFDHNRSETHT